MSEPETKHDRDIRRRAMRMWQEAGYPKGRKDDYLEQARELQAFVEHPGAALVANPMVDHPQPDASKEPVEEAELLENLGEFPGWTDQGDRMTAPMTKLKARDFLSHG
jgi:hypothetical protein